LRVRGVARHPHPRRVELVEVGQRLLLEEAAQVGGLRRLLDGLDDGVRGLRLVGGALRVGVGRGGLVRVLLELGVELLGVLRVGRLGIGVLLIGLPGERAQRVHLAGEGVVLERIRRAAHRRPA